MPPTLSRPRLAADVRECGLPLIVHLSHFGLPPLHQFATNGGMVSYYNRDPSSVPSLQMVDGSKVTFLTLSLSPFFSFEYLGARRPALDPALSAVAGSFVSLSCFFSLIRDGLYCGWHGAPRFLTVVRSPGVCWILPAISVTPLVGLRPFSLPLFHPELRLAALSFLWFFVVSCGTGWASTSSDNI